MALQENLKQQGDFLFKFRSHLPLLLLITGICVKVYQVYFVGDNNRTTLVEIMESAAIFVGLSGFLIRVFTVGYSQPNTSGRNTKDGQIADSLNTTGVYSLIRNPLYLGNYLMWLAIAMLTGSISFVLIFSLVFWIYYERIVYAEESFLRNKFGHIFLDWAANTPIFIPTHFNYTKPNASFGWKKVLRKEKNGLFALFLLFYLFKAVGEYVEKGSILIQETWVIVGAITTGLIYCILKYMKKYTNILKEN